jgi:deoxyribodipyrimidine photo-lyase
MTPPPVILWFRFDLRLADHPALSAAAASGRPVIPVFLDAPEDEGRWPLGKGSRVWLRCSLESLDAALRRRSSRLILRRGRATEVLPELAGDTGAAAVYWNERVEPAAIEVSTRLKRRLEQQGVEARGFPASTLYAPGEVVTAQGTSYRVFTPFSRACLALGDPPPPLPTPRRWLSPRAWPASDDPDRLFPEADGAPRIPKPLQPGTRGAWKRLDAFLSERVDAYPVARDRIDEDGASGIAPHLRFGEFSAREVWHAVRRATANAPSTRDRGAAGFLRQLLWREFAMMTLLSEPAMPEKPIHAQFANFPWRRDARGLAAWKAGRTGYPLVDAAMRELAATGCMHNRLRMVAASFLCKHLLLSWAEGEAWFWERLLDADLANNAFGWQWVAGCGLDAAPFIRVFNPVAQGERFDPEGRYIVKWIPELESLHPKHRHAPWTAPSDFFFSGGHGYARPIVDHRDARVRALAAFEAVRKSRAK